MTQARSESVGSPIWGTFAKQAAFITALLFFLFFAFATYSYNPSDAGWFYSGDGGATQNSMGVIGAGLADLMSAFFGSLFYTLPLLFLLVAFILWRNPHRLIPLNNALLCSIGSILYLSFGSALCFLHTVGDGSLQFGAGGILGQELGRMLYHWIGYDGATLVSLALFILACTLLAQIHWNQLIEFVGERALMGYQWLVNKLEREPKEESDTSAQAAESDLEKPAIFRKKRPTPQTSEPETLVATEPELEDEAPVPSTWQKLKAKLKRRGSESMQPDDYAYANASAGSNAHVEPSFSGLDSVPVDKGEVDFGDTLYVEPDTDDLDFDSVWGSSKTTGSSPTTPSQPFNAQSASTQDDQEAYDEEPLQRAAPSPVTSTDASAAMSISDNEQRTEDSPVMAQTGASRPSQPPVDVVAAHKPAVKTLSEAKRLESLGGPSTEIERTEAAYTLPDRRVLTQPKPKQGGYSEDELLNLSALLEQRLQDFGVKAEVVEVNPGPVITRFEIQPAPGVKVSRITNLAKDLARSLSVMSVRVVEVIAGKSTIGIEIPNQIRDTVYFSEVINTPMYDNASSPLTLSLGHDISGEPVVVDLAKMPHVLVAGTTGSGKSVGVNAMILSMLLKSTPDEVRMIMVDPKMLELSIYEGIPHLLTPVITDMKDAANGLRWSVDEMERRYKLMAKLGVRNIAGFNKKVREAAAAGEPIEDPLWTPEMAMFSEDGVARTVPYLEPLPYIVIVVDEFADMMMIVGKKVEELIARIAQKARAAGIHLILATQRPSVDVITGLIKANIPTRMAFQVSSKIDSRTILDQGGADQLLGQGDMLYLPAGLPTPIRVHGAFVSDDEVHAVVEEWKARGEPQYINDVTVSAEELTSGGGEDKDALYDEAVKIVIETRKASISSIQRRLKIGYNRAANLVEAMESAGLVGPMGTNGQREILIPE